MISALYFIFIIPLLNSCTSISEMCCYFEKNTKMDREKLISTLKSVIISKKGGVHISKIDGEYKELMGENIPLKSLTGCNDLLTFLRSVPGVSVMQGIVTATSVKSAHIAKMISKQKTKVDRRVNVKRLDGAKKYSAHQYKNQIFQAPTSSKGGRAYTSFTSNYAQQPHFRRFNRNIPTQYGDNITQHKFAGYNRPETFNNNYYKRPLLHHMNGWKVIGDDLMLSVMNNSQPYQYDPLCRSGLTIRNATVEVLRNGCPNKVIIVLGSVDVLMGNSGIQIKGDMFNLLNAIHNCGSDFVVCTLPPLCNASHKWERVKALMELNYWILQSRHKVTDLNLLFSNSDWSIDYSCFELKPVYCSGCSETQILWSERGRRIVQQNLYALSGHLNSVYFSSHYAETTAPSSYLGELILYLTDRVKQLSA